MRYTTLILTRELLVHAIINAGTVNILLIGNRQTEQYNVLNSGGIPQRRS